MKRTLFGIVLVLCIFGGLGLAARQAVRSGAANQAVYRLSAAQIVVPNRPAWVPDDFVETTLRNANLDAPGSLLDKTLPRELSLAFTASPWVEEVERVTLRYPSGADIRLTYRTPAALVNVEPQGHFPVDRNGVLLPTDYFFAAPEKVPEYMQIRGVHSQPLGAAGTRWGDPLVHTAAGLAGELQDVAGKLRLTAVVPIQEKSPAGNRVICRLATKKGTEILWGRFEADDPKNAVRKKHLLELAEIYGSLDDIPKNFLPIDLTKE